MNRAANYILLVGLILVLFLAIAFVVGGRSFTRTAWREIAAPPDEVMSSLRESEKVIKWMRDVKSVTDVEPDDDGNLSRYIRAHDDIYVQKITIVDKESMTIRFSDRYSTVEDVYTLKRITAGESDGSRTHEVTGTELRRVVRHEYEGWYRILAPFIRNAIQRRLGSEMEGIKQVSEGGELQNSQATDAA